MRLAILAASITFAAAMTGSAFAADAVAELPVTSTYNWTGAYVGAQAGHLWSKGDMTFSITGDYANPKPQGFLGGIYGGANYQFSNDVVVGVDADFAWTKADATMHFYDRAGVEHPESSGIQDVKWQGAVRARLGYAFDRWLPYIAGGVAFAHVDQNVVSGTRPYDDYSHTYTAWTLGAGVEYAFTDNLVGRFEYRYTDFGSQDFPGHNFPDINIVPLTTKLASNDIRIGIAYKF